MLASYHHLSILSYLHTTLQLMAGKSLSSNSKFLWTTEMILSNVQNLSVSWLCWISRYNSLFYFHECWVFPAILEKHYFIYEVLYFCVLQDFWTDDLNIRVPNLSIDGITVVFSLKPSILKVTFPIGLLSFPCITFPTLTCKQITNRSIKVSFIKWGSLLLCLWNKSLLQSFHVFYALKKGMQFIKNFMLCKLFEVTVIYFFSGVSWVLYLRGEWHAHPMQHSGAEVAKWAENEYCIYKKIDFLC